MIEYQLTRGKIALIDDDDLPLVEGKRWWPCQTKTSIYAITRLGNGVVLGMHRLILNAPCGVWVDHRDGDGLNNQRSNIRLATPSQNACNQRAIQGVSRYRGVSWNKAARKWHAQIKAEGRRLHLGLFDEERAAAVAYDQAAIRHFGEFATLNLLRS
jgi:hypothetical protein